MTKFSVSRDAEDDDCDYDEEGICLSTPEPKRRRLSGGTSSSSTPLPNTDTDVASSKTILCRCENGSVSRGEGLSRVERDLVYDRRAEAEDRSSMDGSISVVLSDPDVLDCPVCFDPLTIPVYQVTASVWLNDLRDQTKSATDPLIMTMSSNETTNMIEEEDTRNKTVPTAESLHEIDALDKTVSSNPPTRLRKRTSMVWDHFKAKNDPADPDCYICIHCDGELHQTSKNGTSSLRTHLNKCKKYPCNVDKRQKLLALEVMSTVQSDGSIITCGQLKDWVFDQVAVRKALARMLIIDELPFMFVEHQGFREFCMVACPQFFVPSRSTITRDIFGLFIDERKKLKDFFGKLTSRVCLTTDTWTSGQNLCYMCLTAHFIDENWTLQKRIINFCSIAGHSGEFIGRAVEGCLVEWGLKNILTMTVDNAKSNDGAVRYLGRRINHWGSSVMDCKFLHMRCAAHILNFVVKDGLKEMDSSIVKVRHFVKFVRSSPARLKAFRQCVEEEQIHSKGLVCLDVDTRWNSTFLMLKSAVKFRRAFDSLYCKNSICNKELRKNGGAPSESDWDKASSFLPFLEIFYEATLNLSGSNYVTTNCYVDMIYGVGNLISEYCESEDEALKDMATQMKMKYEKYWGDVDNMNMLLFVALVLDPRHKLSSVEEMIADAYEESNASLLIGKIKSTLSALFDFYGSSMPQASGKKQQTPASSQSKDSSLGSNSLTVKPHFNLKYSRQRGTVETSARISEIDRYLAEDCEPNDEDEDGADHREKLQILGWWKDQRKRFPILAAMARDILAIPVSSVASESAFSTEGRVLDPFRTALTPRMAEALVCTQDWLRPTTTPIMLDEIIFELEDMEMDEGMKELTAQQPIIAIDESLDFSND